MVREKEQAPHLHVVVVVVLGSSSSLCGVWQLNHWTGSTVNGYRKQCSGCLNSFEGTIYYGNLRCSGCRTTKNIPSNLWNTPNCCSLSCLTSVANRTDGAGTNHQKSTTCSNCNGTGKITTTPNCSSCSGSGKKTCSRCSGSGRIICSDCLGAGKKNHSACNGNGYILTPYNCIHGKGPNNSHYYCSSHGNDVQQYH